MAGKVMRRPGLSRKLLAIHEHTAAGRDRRDRRPRHHPARRPLAPSRDRWHHRPLHHRLPAALDRARDHRRLSRRRCSASASTPAGGSVRASGARPTVRRSSSRLLGLVHAFGSGTDASAVWFRWWVMLTTPVIGGLFVYRVFGAPPGRGSVARPAAPARTDLTNPRPRGGMMKDDGVLIVGGGLAAQRCAEALRRRGYDGPVRMACAEPSPPYDRPPLSKELLAGAIEEDSIAYRPSWWYDEKEIELVLGERAEALDPEARTVRLEGGATAALREAADRDRERRPSPALPRRLRERARAPHPRRRARCFGASSRRAPGWRSSAPGSSARRSRPPPAASGSR